MIVRVSEADVELPSSLRSFFFKAKTCLGLILKNWSWFCKPLLVELIWWVPSVSCAGAAPGRPGAGQLF